MVQTLHCTGPEVNNPTVDEGIPPCPVACLVTPCLFNIFDDPLEYNNLAASQPALLQSMHTQFEQLVAEYSAPNDPNDPPLSALQWQFGYHVDGRGTASPGCQMVNKTGWWRPWVNATTLS